MCAGPAPQHKRLDINDLSRANAGSQGRKCSWLVASHPEIGQPEA